MLRKKDMVFIIIDTMVDRESSERSPLKNFPAQQFLLPILLSYYNIAICYTENKEKKARCFLLSYTAIDREYNRIFSLVSDII